MLTIRPATSADAQVAYDIRREAVRHHCIGAYPAEQMLAFLEALARNLGLAQVNLDATLNAAAFYRQCGYVGEATALYHSPRGIDLACVPMTKVLV
ncbi:N-acetyltransferase [Pseudomonas sp. FBF18]|uniref:GNAT family N-acetyltransferase n=1 Tax=Pseudomonas TaxID=286 RepID=UPI0006D3CBCB|nr:MULTISPECIES: GNAT family N-acetyltransferase [Pseudomonas]MBG8559463.1 N-acetyltransferase [Pseudomonas qingdaonensis]MCP8350956.1 N-acetyltransferase [Pseudomonas sp. FBF18]